MSERECTSCSNGLSNCTCVNISDIESRPGYYAENNPEHELKTMATVIRLLSVALEDVNIQHKKDFHEDTCLKTMGCHCTPTYTDAVLAEVKGLCKI